MLIVNDLSSCDSNTAAGAGPVVVEISGAVKNLNTEVLFAAPTVSADYILRIMEDALVGSVSAGTAALIVHAFPAASTFTLEMHHGSTIVGCGGRGANGSQWYIYNTYAAGGGGGRGWSGGAGGLGGNKGTAGNFYAPGVGGAGDGTEWSSGFPGGDGGDAVQILGGQAVDLYSPTGAVVRVAGGGGGGGAFRWEWPLFWYNVPGGNGGELGEAGDALWSGYTRWNPGNAGHSFVLEGGASYTETGDGVLISYGPELTV
jgi:hypothetical protein